MKKKTVGGVKLVLSENVGVREGLEGRKEG